MSRRPESDYLYSSPPPLLEQKSAKSVQKSLFAPEVTFRDSDLQKGPNFTSTKKGFAAVARAGAKSPDSAKFIGRSTFGAKMIPKVTFCGFQVPKATCPAEARGCASRQWFLNVFFDPRELKCDFCAQRSLFLTFSTLAPKVTFGRKSDL